MLEDTSFNLVSWYRRYVNATGKFESRYIESHLGTVQPEVAPPEIPMCHTCASNSSCPFSNCSVLEPNPTVEVESDYPEIEFMNQDSDEDIRSIPDLKLVSDSEDEYYTSDDDKGNLTKGADMSSSESSPVESKIPGVDSEDIYLSNLTECYLGSVGDALINQAKAVLTHCQPYPSDSTPVDPTYKPGCPQFIIDPQDFDMFIIYDRVQGFEAHTVTQKTVSIFGYFDL